MACGYLVTWGGGFYAAARTCKGATSVFFTLLLCVAAAVDGVDAAVPTLVLVCVQ